MSTDVQVATAPDFLSSCPTICPHGGRKLFLPRAALDIMEDYFCNESQWPEKPARVALARSVNTALQCGCYTAQHVYMHFVYLRRRAKIPAPSGRPRSRSPSPDSQSDIPDKRTGTVGELDGPEFESQSGSGSVVAKLDVLLAEEPSPTPAVAAVWADVLAEGVTPEDILTYALLRQVKRHIVESQSFHADGTVLAAAQTQVLPPEPASPQSPVSSHTVSLDQAAPRQLPLRWRSPLTESSVPGAKRRREGRPHIQSMKRAKQPPAVSPPSSFCYDTTLSDGEDRREAELLPIPTSAAGVPPVEAIEVQPWQVLAAQIRHALSKEKAPAGPQPTTFSDLCAWLRGSGSMAAL